LAANRRTHPVFGDALCLGTVDIMALLKKLAAAIAVGFGMLFASKAKDQHWSESPSVLVDEARAEGESSDE
jgi:hypothetical protein